MTWTLVGKSKVLEGPSWERGRIVEYEACLGIVVSGRARVWGEARGHDVAME